MSDLEESRKVYGWLVRDENAAAGCSSMGADARGGEYYCDNLQWQSCQTIYFPELVKIDNFKARFFRIDNFVTSFYTTFLL